MQTDLGIQVGSKGNNTMKNIVAIMMLLVLGAGITACKGKQTTGPSGTNHHSGDETVRPLAPPPAWFLNKIGENARNVYGYGQSSGERNPAAARRAAVAAAQRELAEFVSTRVQAMTEQYLKEVIGNDATRSVSQMEDAIRTLTDTRLGGFRVDKEDVIGHYYYARGYLDTDALADLASALRNSADVSRELDRVQADKDAFFNRLDNALKQQDAFKRE